MFEKTLPYIAVIVSLLGAIVSIIATLIAMRARKTAELSLRTKKGEILKGESIEEIGQDTAVDEDPEDGRE